MKKRLMKVLGGLLAVVLLLVLVAPAGVGMMAEGRYKQVWRDMLAAEPGFEAEVTAFDRGWFRSQAEVSLAVTDATLAALLIDMGWADEDNDGRAVMRLQEGIHHGPVPFTAPAPFWQRWRPGFAVVDSRLDENMPMIAEYGVDASHTVHLGITGRMNGYLHIPAFDIRLEEGLRLDNRDKMSAEWRSNRHFDRLDLRMRAGEFRLLGEQGIEVVMESPWMQINQRRGPADVWLGGSEFRLSSVDIRAAGGGSSRMENLVWATTAREEKALINQKHEIGIETLRVDDFQAGPMEKKVDLYRLHPQGLAELQRAMSEWTPLEAEEAAVGDEFFDVLREPLFAIATHQPGVRLEYLRLTLPGGDVEVNGHMELIEMSRSRLEAHLEEGRFVQMVEGEARIGAARDLARRALAYSLLGQLPHGAMEDDMRDLMDMQLNAAVAEGMLTETEDGFQVHLGLKDGVLKVNGRELLRF